MKINRVFYRLSIEHGDDLAKNKGPQYFRDKGKAKAFARRILKSNGEIERVSIFEVNGGVERFCIEYIGEDFR